MNTYTVGQLVYSKAGRDKLKQFVIIHVDDEYVYLVDGKLRPISRPKKKKKKHIQPTNYVAKEITCSLINNQEILDADIQKAIRSFEE